jgi:hypothetical protein
MRQDWCTEKGIDLLVSIIPSSSVNAILRVLIAGMGLGTRCESAAIFEQVDIRKR